MPNPIVRLLRTVRIAIAEPTANVHQRFPGRTNGLNHHHCIDAKRAPVECAFWVIRINSQEMG
jgi:hypothetical protein